MSQIPEESPNKYGIFDTDCDELKGADMDRACRIAAELEKKRGRPETEEERLERICKPDLSSLQSLLSRYR